MYGGDGARAVSRACWSRRIREGPLGVEATTTAGTRRSLSQTATNKRCATLARVGPTAGIYLRCLAAWLLFAAALPPAGHAPAPPWPQGQRQGAGQPPDRPAPGWGHHEPPHPGGRPLRMPSRASFAPSTFQHSSHVHPFRSFQGVAAHSDHQSDSQNGGLALPHGGAGDPQAGPGVTPRTWKARLHAGLLPGQQDRVTAPHSSHVQGLPEARHAAGQVAGREPKSPASPATPATPARKAGEWPPQHWVESALGAGRGGWLHAGPWPGAPTTPPRREGGGLPSPAVRWSPLFTTAGSGDQWGVRHHGRSGSDMLEAPSPRRKSSSEPAGSAEVSRGPRPPHVDTYGFFLEAYPAGSAPPPSGANAPPDSARWGRHVRQWRRMLGPTGSRLRAFYVQNPFVVKRRVRKGIPDELRGLAWVHLSGGSELLRRNPGVYHRLTRGDSEMSPQIKKDLHRTFPNHVYFAKKGGTGQQALFRVLKAYACYDPEVGYVQGMGSIAAVLLLYMREEEAFWTFCALMTRHATDREAAVGPGPNCRRLFVEGLPLLKTIFAKFELLLGDKVPRLASQLRDQGVNVSLYSARWWMTLFTFTLPFSHVVRVWDMFMLEGWKAALRAGIAVMKCAEGALLGKDFEDLVQRVRPESLVGLVKSPDEFVKIALKIKTSKALRGWNEPLVDADSST